MTFAAANCHEISTLSTRTGFVAAHWNAINISSTTATVVPVSVAMRKPLRILVELRT